MVLSIGKEALYMIISIGIGFTFADMVHHTLTLIGLTYVHMNIDTC